jgi:hypothetical protein
MCFREQPISQGTDVSLPIQALDIVLRRPYHHSLPEEIDVGPAIGSIIATGAGGLISTAAP